MRFADPRGREPGKIRAGLRFRAAVLGMLACGAAGAAETGIGMIEWEARLPPASGIPPFPVVLAYPDSLAGSDTRAILDALSPGMAKPVLPRGRLNGDEQTFLAGLRSLLDGNALSALQSWGSLRPRGLSPRLAGSLRVDAGVISLMMGEPAVAESLWITEWRQGAAAEAAWRNLLALQFAAGRFRRAEQLADAMLAEKPGQRAALMAKAMLLKQFGTEDAWEEFVRTRALGSPDMQLVYGELLLRRGRYAEAVRYLDQGLAELPASGRGWQMLAEAQYRRGYYYFAIDCMQNAARAGYHPAEFYELYARILQDCCTGDADPRAVRARAAAERLLEEGLPKDLHRRSMAQLLYHMYCQNEKPDAARALEKNLWFHFEGPRRDVPALGNPDWTNAGLQARALRVRFGLYAFPWVMTLRRTDVFHATL